MTFAEICSLVQKAASIASFLDPEPTSKGILADVAAAAQIAPAVVLDAQDALARIKGLFGGILPGASVLPIEPKHIDAINTVHEAIGSYEKRSGRTLISPVPGQ